MSEAPFMTALEARTKAKNDHAALVKKQSEQLIELIKKEITCEVARQRFSTQIDQNSLPMKDVQEVVSKYFTDLGYAIEFKEG